MYDLYGLKHHIVEIRGDVAMWDGRQTNKQLKIEILSQWKLEAEFRNKNVTKLFTGLLQPTIKEGTGSFVSGGPFRPEGEPPKISSMEAPAPYQTDDDDYQRTSGSSATAS